MKSLELLFATLSLFVVTTVASFIYYMKISQAQEEYENARDVVKGITSGFTRQLSKIAAAISSFESDASDAQRAASQAIEASRVAVEASRSGVDERRALAEQLESAEKTLEEMRMEIQELSRRPVPLVP